MCLYPPWGGHWYRSSVPVHKQPLNEEPPFTAAKRPAKSPGLERSIHLFHRHTGDFQRHVSTLQITFPLLNRPTHTHTPTHTHPHTPASAKAYPEFTAERTWSIHSVPRRTNPLMKNAS